MIDPEQWLTAEQVGELLGYSAGAVRQRIVCKPGFPKAMYIDGGNPRWKRGEVNAWADMIRAKGRGGRPRGQPEGELQPETQQ